MKKIRIENNFAEKKASLTLIKHEKKKKNIFCF